ncbi:MAG: hypothetical protein ACOYKE_06670 [Ferruginibacter sp.]
MKKQNHLKSFNLLFALILVTVFTTLQSSTCSKNDDFSNAPTVQAVPSGNWKLNLYWDVTDETYKFNSYQFAFLNSGVVTATYGTTTVNGTWVETATRFSIDFGADPLLRKLSHNWVITQRSATSIQLKDDNPTKDEKIYFIKL